MGHHIDSEGRFQSDKYPELPPDKIVLSFKDPIAQECLAIYAAHTADLGLGQDIKDRLYAIQTEGAP